MASALAALPERSRVTDYISLGSITDPTIFSFFLDDIVGLPFEIHSTSVDVSHHIGTNGLECTLKKSAIRNSMRIRLF